MILDIDGPAHGGAAVARFGPEAGERAGQVVFVRGALPGETGVPVILDPAPSAARRFLTGQVADVTLITGVSPHRVAPVCAAAAAGAGCCDLDIVDVDGAAEWKRRVVVDQFTRIGHLDLGAGERVPVTVVSPPPQTGYRTRVRLGVDRDGQVGLRRFGSHGIVPVDRAVCAQWAPALVDGLAEELASLDPTPGAEICIAVGDNGARSVVELTKEPTGRKTSRGRRPGRRRDTTVRRRTRRRVLVGDGTVTHTVNGVTWTVPAEAFWQAHLSAPSVYSSWIASTLAGTQPVTEPSGTAGESGRPVVWDLYGGAGVFAAAVADALPGTAVDSVDIASDSTAVGQTVLADRDVRFVDGDVGACLPELRGAGDDGHPLHAVVLDPPRTGAGKKVLEEIAQRCPEHILHIGCDPATAARDAGILCSHGYRPVSLTAVDAFGLTHHVEVLAHYVRDAGQR
ncbi:class I SAM-dependent RNA methyltransferase [Corynebacterium terpenotabidum]|uniref:TRAM domain-containing protein n=1 Tax=Corynebacterium terpenotabidum Y-11 TaxID=1200352 RepID=S4XEB3_9CORY|nr:class I SAM-dependent RNA methyltransferase [Corynebacterium terpenotabidum]AGP30896.1 hypothetical protein A606_06245 [Corynebacterium terpenotabidum Y-11]